MKSGMSGILGRITPIIVAVISIMASCSRYLPGGRYEERTVNGVHERTYLSSRAPGVNPYRLELGTVFGEDQGEGSYLFSTPRIAGIGDDGTVFIMDLRRKVVHRFTAGGEHLGSFGRAGQGPGEFSSGPMVGYVFDRRVFIYDLNAGKMAVFDREGRLLEDRRWPSLVEFSRPVPFHTSGGVRYLILDYGGAISAESEIRRMKIFPLDDRGEPAAVIIDTTLTREVLHIGTRTVQIPFTRFGGTIAVAPDMPVALWFPGEYRLDFIDPWEGTKWAVVVPMDRVPVTAKLKNRRIAAFAGSGLAEEARRNLRFPRHLPFISSMMWGTDGRLWVLDYIPFIELAEVFSYNVFDREGTWLFSQELPFLGAGFTEDGVFVQSEMEDGSPVIEYYLMVER